MLLIGRSYNIKGKNNIWVKWTIEENRRGCLSKRRLGGRNTKNEIRRNRRKKEKRRENKGKIK